MKSGLVFTIGNGMMGDDGVGPLLAEWLYKNPAPGWEILNGGSAPENAIHTVREIAPEKMIVLDAVDMDLPAGSIRYIPIEKLDDPFLFSTHTLPLSFLIQAFAEFVPRIEFLGIQPKLIAFGLPMSAEVREAVEQVYNRLIAGECRWDWL